MMPTLQLRRTSLFWFQGAWELGRGFGDDLFCLFVFQLPRWVIILFLCLTSGWGFPFFVGVGVCVCVCVCVCFFFCFCFCIFFKMFNFPTIYLGSGWFFFFFFFFFFFLSCWLVKFFAFFYFCLFVFILFCFVFVLLPKIPPPLISNGAPLSLFYYTDDGGHYVIDNYEFQCNSVKNLIPIWNFTNTLIQESKMIWESVEAGPHSSDLYGDHGDI